MSENNNITIFEFLRTDGYMSVNKKLACAIGLNEAIIYGELISRYLYFKERGKLENGYFYNTVDDLEQATTLSKNQQPKAVKKLCELKLIDCQINNPAARLRGITVTCSND